MFESGAFDRGVETLYLSGHRGNVYLLPPVPVRDALPDAGTKYRVVIPVFLTVGYCRCVLYGIIQQSRYCCTPKYRYMYSMELCCMQRRTCLFPADIRIYVEVQQCVILPTPTGCLVVHLHNTQAAQLLDNFSSSFSRTFLGLGAPVVPLADRLLLRYLPYICSGYLYI